MDYAHAVSDGTAERSRALIYRLVADRAGARSVPTYEHYGFSDSVEDFARAGLAAGAGRRWRRLRSRLRDRESADRALRNRDRMRCTAPPCTPSARNLPDRPRMQRRSTGKLRRTVALRLPFLSCASRRTRSPLGEDQVNNLVASSVAPTKKTAARALQLRRKPQRSRSMAG
jgi:hypothetical protein